MKNAMKKVSKEMPIKVPIISTNTSLPAIMVGSSLSVYDSNESMMPMPAPAMQITGIYTVTHGRGSQYIFP